MKAGEDLLPAFIDCSSKSPQGRSAPPAYRTGDRFIEPKSVLARLSRAGRLPKKHRTGRLRAQSMAQAHRLPTRNRNKRGQDESTAVSPLRSEPCDRAKELHQRFLNKLSRVSRKCLGLSLLFFNFVA
jgi:hypothetical protein